MRCTNRLCLHLMALSLLFFLCSTALAQQPLTLVELNCENLFDMRHDSLKQDHEFLPGGACRWTPYKYWTKLNAIGKALLASSDELPDIVALCEVEGDTVLHDLTRRSLLRNAGFSYLVTESPDVRGIDVALLYRPVRFRPLCYDFITVHPLPGMRPTRDILYVKGRVVTGDTLHLFVVHAPSRYGGELPTRSHRLHVAEALKAAIDSIGMSQNVIIAGDFNDYADSPALRYLTTHRLRNVTQQAKGRHGARATYRYDGLWASIDHILATPSAAKRVVDAYIGDAPFLLEADEKYGGQKPFRTFSGFRYHGGTSDHLPLVARFRF